MDKKNCPRVLVISHNVFSETSNMGATLYSLFHDWPRESIAQLYLHTEVPTTKICHTYYRITDFDMIDAILHRHKPGKILTKADIRTDLNTERVDKGKQADIYQWGRQRRPYMVIGRNLIWATRKWDTPELHQWIDEFQPEIVFFASGDYVFSYKIALSIASRWEIPLAVSVMDDYYIYRRRSISPLYWLNRAQFRHTFRKVATYQSLFVYICDSMQKDYDSLFHTHGVVIMTPATLDLPCLLYTSPSPRDS